MRRPAAAAAAAGTIRARGARVRRVADPTPSPPRGPRVACAHVARAPCPRAAEIALARMTVFYVCGGLTALWAVLVSGLGIARENFPGGKGGERVVIAISALLVAASIGSAVVGSALEDEEPAEEAALVAPG